MAAQTKSLQTLVVDTGAVIKNDPSPSTLRNSAERLITTPAIVSEIRDAATRTRFETTLKPFLTLQTPSQSSIKFVTDFARKTGDLSVLSKADIEIIALTYQLECEANGGDWRLRRTPGQKGINGRPPEKKSNPELQSAAAVVESTSGTNETHQAEHDSTVPEKDVVPNIADTYLIDDANLELKDSDAVSLGLEDLNLSGKRAEDEPPTADIQEQVDSPLNSAESQDASDSDAESDGWITPSNLKRKQAVDNGGAANQAEDLTNMQVAMITSDYAMQNVTLQINLNLLSPNMSRIQQIRTYVLRCHACFQVCKDLTKQFCPRCGQATLTRVSCSTNSKGEFKLHLKRTMQWNHRGDRYSIPKPVHGSANGRIKGAGKGGWGNDLMLVEDQKEYQAATQTQKRQQERNLMDEDYLPSILTGDRGKAGGRLRVGAGRNVNSRKR